MGFYPFDFAEPQGKQVSCPACGMNKFFESGFTIDDGELTIRSWSSRLKDSAFKVCSFRQTIIHSQFDGADSQKDEAFRIENSQQKLLLYITARMRNLDHSQFRSLMHHEKKTFCGSKGSSQTPWLAS
ncbi:hypothetical protein POTOM_044776 [Populus tomentosa]|uniref:Uncharacterized protein n=1 Tax=Populus tomentosa TaxID=118781 RepID=A0A8X7YMF6_POPTO|nr:hypothetical protein POTOM_044776 [Populus tomentosa]